MVKMFDIDWNIIIQYQFLIQMNMMNAWADGREWKTEGGGGGVNPGPIFPVGEGYVRRRGNIIDTQIRAKWTVYIVYL